LIFMFACVVEINNVGVVMYEKMLG